MPSITYGPLPTKRLDGLPASESHRRVAGRRRLPAWRRCRGSRTPGGAARRPASSRPAPDADLVLLGRSGEPLGRSSHDAEDVRGGGLGGGVEQAQPRAADVLGGERRAVAEGQVVADGELVGEAVVADLPAGGQRGVWLPGLIEPRQPRVQLEQELHVAGVGDEGRVERAGSSAEVAKRRAGGRRRRCRRPQRQYEQARRDERGHPGQTSHAGSSSRRARGGLGARRLVYGRRAARP